MISISASSKKKFYCPECGGRMIFQGYRPLFPTCEECGETFYLDDCESKE